MAAILTTSLLILCSRGLASPVSPFGHHYGVCKEFDIPVSVTSESAVYSLPKVNNNIEAVAWAIHDTTWSNPVGAQRIIENTTTSGTYNIHAQLCVPKSSEKNENILQIATHGVHYDSRYWDSKLDPEQHSYVEAALKAGYSILTYDRLGVGQSDISDAYTVVQGPLEVEILQQLTLMARNGTLDEFASEASPKDPAFNSLAVPDKVVHVGHSFGSVLTSAFIAKYGSLTDGAVITGYLLNQYLAKAGSVAWAVEFAAMSSPPFDRPSGYVVCQKSGIQTLFFGGDPQTAFTKEMLDYGDDIKQPVLIGELASGPAILTFDGSSFEGPIQYMLPEFDYYICDGDCKGLFDAQTVAKTWPNAVAIELAIQPNTGHALPLHNNATAGFQVTFDFLARHGL